MNAEDDLRRIYSEHRALAILRALQRITDYRTNHRILADYLDTLALGGAEDYALRTVESLERLGLVKLEKLEMGLVGVSLTSKGENVALGRETAAGVRRPGPDGSY